MPFDPKIKGELVALFFLPATLLAQAPPAADQPPPAFKLEVIGATPMPGLDLLLKEIPAPVQTALSRDIDASGALDLGDLNRRMNGVFVNEMQGNRSSQTSPTAALPRRRCLALRRGCRSTWTAFASIRRSGMSSAGI
ncbi:MAG TPA: hypothetical protein VGH34_00785 [Vicinamibacterales bacterium]